MMMCAEGREVFFNVRKSIGDVWLDAIGRIPAKVHLRPRLSLRGGNDSEWLEKNCQDMEKSCQDWLEKSYREHGKDAVQDFIRHRLTAPAADVQAMLQVDAVGGAGANRAPSTQDNDQDASRAVVAEKPVMVVQDYSFREAVKMMEEIARPEATASKLNANERKNRASVIQACERVIMAKDQISAKKLQHHGTIMRTRKELAYLQELRRSLFYRMGLIRDAKRDLGVSTGLAGDNFEAEMQDPDFPNYKDTLHPVTVVSHLVETDEYLCSLDAFDGESGRLANVISRLNISIGRQEGPKS